MKISRFSAAVLLAIVGAALPAHATQYFTPTTVLTSFFKGAEHVRHRSITLSDAEAAEIGKQLGQGPIPKGWSVYFPEAGGQRTDGFAILDHELGMHENIDFAVRFTGKGAVDLVEIMEYREAYGDEVRAERFRKQFVGKTAKDPLVAGKDIQIITGASISSRSMALGVKRDALVLDRALANGSL